MLLSSVLCVADVQCQSPAAGWHVPGMVLLITVKAKMSQASSCDPLALLLIQGFSATPPLPHVCTNLESWKWKVLPTERACCSLHSVTQVTR